MNAGPEVRNIVLVHDGFADGAGWQGVYDHLTADGHRGAVVQHPNVVALAYIAAFAPRRRPPEAAPPTRRTPCGCFTTSSGCGRSLAYWISDPMSPEPTCLTAPRAP